MALSRFNRFKKLLSFEIRRRTSKTSIECRIFSLLSLLFLGMSLVWVIITNQNSFEIGVCPAQLIGTVDSVRLAVGVYDGSRGPRYEARYLAIYHYDYKGNSYTGSGVSLAPNPATVTLHPGQYIIVTVNRFWPEVSMIGEPGANLISAFELMLLALIAIAFFAVIEIVIINKFRLDARNMHPDHVTHKI